MQTIPKAGMSPEELEQYNIELVKAEFLKTFNDAPKNAIIKKLQNPSGSGHGGIFIIGVNNDGIVKEYIAKASTSEKETNEINNAYALLKENYDETQYPNIFIPKPYNIIKNIFEEPNDDKNCSLIIMDKAPGETIEDTLVSAIQTNNVDLFESVLGEYLKTLMTLLNKGLVYDLNLGNMMFDKSTNKISIIDYSDCKKSDLTKKNKLSILGTGESMCKTIFIRIYTLIASVLVEKFDKDKELINAPDSIVNTYTLNSISSYFQLVLKIMKEKDAVNDKPEEFINQHKGLLTIFYKLYFPCNKRRIQQDAKEISNDITKEFSILKSEPKEFVKKVASYSLDVKTLDSYRTSIKIHRFFRRSTCTLLCTGIMSTLSYFIKKSQGHKKLLETLLSPFTNASKIAAATAVIGVCLPMFIKDEHRCGMNTAISILTIVTALYGKKLTLIYDALKLCAVVNTFCEKGGVNNGYNIVLSVLVSQAIVYFASHCVTSLKDSKITSLLEYAICIGLTVTQSYININKCKESLGEDFTYANLIASSIVACAAMAATQCGIAPFAVIQIGMMFSDFAIERSKGISLS